MTPDRSISPLIRSKTAAQWTAENPYLHRGDLGIESDTGKQKLGEGSPWASTSYSPAVDATNVVKSDTTGIAGASQITNVVKLTQAQYNAITPDTSTLYIIT